MLGPFNPATMEFNQQQPTEPQLSPNSGSVTPISFRQRHSLLNKAYNDCPDPDNISANQLDAIHRHVGLPMEEVLGWFKDEKLRRAKLEHSFRLRQLAPPFPQPSLGMITPNTTTAGTRTMAGSVVSASDASQMQEVMSHASPTPTATTDHTSPIAQRRRGRPPKTEDDASVAGMSGIPKAKRQKPTFQHPCVDCKRVFDDDRWAEHVRRVHFPDYVYVCQKDKCRATSKPFYRGDNFVTHLKGEHHCSPQEINQLKESSKFEVVNFYHKVCGFCGEALKSRDQGIEHIKDHFKRYSMSDPQPRDMGVSNWTESCGTTHILTRGVHYQLQVETAATQDENVDRRDDGPSGDGQSDDKSNGDGHHDHHSDFSGNGDGSAGDEDLYSSGDFDFMDFSQYSCAKDGEATKSDASYSPYPSIRKLTRTLSLLRSRTQQNSPARDASVTPVPGSATSPTKSSSVKTNQQSSTWQKATAVDESEETTTPTTDPPLSPRLDKPSRLRRLSEERTPKPNDISKQGFACEIFACNRVFTRKDHFRDHMRDFHKEDISPRLAEEASVQTTIDRAHTPKPSSASPGLKSAERERNDDSSPEINPLSPDVWRWDSLTNKPHYQVGHEETAFNHREGSPAFHYGMPPYNRDNYFAWSNTVGYEPYPITYPTAVFDEPVAYESAIDPSLIRPSSPNHFDNYFSYPASDSRRPSLSSTSRPPTYNAVNIPTSFGSAVMSTYEPFSSPMYPASASSSRRLNTTHRSSDYFHDESDTCMKGRCPIPDCGKVFKDLKAHMLTHQNERPEKCPIQTCEYHVKGFARVYDKNRHTLTHYKGSLVCGFCPGSGSAAEKSFNRADVFKRHLTSVHGVEQTPPNSRKKSPRSKGSAKPLKGYAPDATGKCSTCQNCFANAQDFYEHLDDCVLGFVQRHDGDYVGETRSIDPTTSLDLLQASQRYLISSEDAEAKASTEDHWTCCKCDRQGCTDCKDKNSKDAQTTNHQMEVGEDERRDLGDPDEEEADDVEEDDDDEYTPRTRRPRSTGMKHSRGGIPLPSRTRKHRKGYPASWGAASTDHDKLKKRIISVVDDRPRYHSKEVETLDPDEWFRFKDPLMDRSKAGEDRVDDDAESLVNPSLVDKVDGIVIAGVGEWMT